MRLLTRSDFDGLACAVLLVEAGIVDSYKFVHPKDVQDGKIKATKNDVLANIPYIEGCGLWFDHHASEDERLELQKDVHYEGDSREAPSCARVIYEYYGGAEKFSKMDETGLMAAVDKSDSADFTADEILNPTGWNLLSFIMDARTGLGRYHDYRISNYRLMEDMIQYCRTMTAEEILENPDVKERTVRYYEQQEAYVAMVKANTRVEDNIVILDLRNVDEIVAGNRFVIYSLFPDTNISIRAIWGRLKQNVVLTVGHSIINRTCQTNVGSLMLMYNGGGHPKVGTCQVPTPDAERCLEEIIEHIKADH